MNALQVYQNGNLSEMMDIGRAMAQSGFFSDAKDASQAIVKIMAGAELGLPPFASMTNVHIIKGKASLGANAIATLIKNSGRYDYRIGEHTVQSCTVIFFENGERVGESTFTMKDAQTAGLLSNPSWGKYPKNMLFARAISNGARWYAPGVFGGSPIYTPDELGANVEYDADGDIVIVEGEVSEVAAPARDYAYAIGQRVMVQGKDAQKPGTVTDQSDGKYQVQIDGNGTYWLSEDKLSELAEDEPADDDLLDTKRKEFFAVGNEYGAFIGEKFGNIRKEMIETLTGKTSTKDMSYSEFDKCIDWMREQMAGQPALIDDEPAPEYS